MLARQRSIATPVELFERPLVQNTFVLVTGQDLTIVIITFLRKVYCCCGSMFDMNFLAPPSTGGSLRLGTFPNITKE
jgi:hypothetical protein